VAAGTPLENIVMVSGIGCHAKIADYLNINSFYSLHGRTIPVAEGIKLGNPELKVICFVGDGDCYGEGLEHLLFAAKRNIDITVIIHDNRVYGLTTGQCTPTSPVGFKGRSTPRGSVEHPINPLLLLLSSGATYIARGYTHGIDLLKKLMKNAIEHKGFSAVDVLQVCATFYNLYEYYNKKVYELKDHDPGDQRAARKRIMEWDYSEEAKFSLGLFFQADRPSYEEAFSVKGADLNERRILVNSLIKPRV